MAAERYNCPFCQNKVRMPYMACDDSSCQEKRSRQDSAIQKLIEFLTTPPPAKKNPPKLMGKEQEFLYPFLKEIIENFSIKEIKKPLYDENSPKHPWKKARDVAEIMFDSDVPLGHHHTNFETGYKPVDDSSSDEPGESENDA